MKKTERQLADRKGILVSIITISETMSRQYNRNNKKF